MPDRRRRLAAGGLIGLVIVVLGAAVGLEIAAAPRAPEARQPVAIDAPDQGILHCPVTAGEGEGAVLAVAPAGDAATHVTVLRYDGQGPPERDDPVALEPEEGHIVDLPGEAGRHPVGVLWEGGPAVATWIVAGGRAAAPCEPAALPTWHLVGFDTTAQNASTLHLFNPFATDAVARVTFGTPTGRVALVLTDNVLVPARTSLRLDLNEYEPEQPDLAATVEVLTGRVVAQGELVMEPTEHQPGPSGRSLLPGVGSPAVTWSFGSADAGEGNASWLAVLNPGERDAAVEVRVSDPRPGAEVLGREFTIPAGSTTRIDLADPSETTTFGVLLESVNDIPVVASRVSHADRGDVEDVAVSAGAAATQVAALAGARTDARRAALSLANLGGEAVTARVSAGAGTPGGWSAIEIAPNARVGLNLAEAGERRALPLRVEADGPVVADLRLLTPGEQFGLWIATLVPSATWEGRGWRPPVRRDPTLSTTPVIPPLEDVALPPE